VEELGREIRFHPRFAPAGTNVNFVQIEDPGTIHVRTYERGVEGETLACGTGVVASAIIAAARGLTSSHVTAKTRGGDILEVYLDGSDLSSMDVHLQGTASLVYRAQLTEETIGGG
jgi:diaminopimelate epimerase